MVSGSVAEGPVEAEDLIDWTIEGALDLVDVDLVVVVVKEKAGSVYG